MGDYEAKLKDALAENAQFKAERADALREGSTTEFRNRIRLAERILWVYLMACAIVAVPTLNLFMGSRDIATLIRCTLVLLVVYETTVLLKLWFAVAGTKLSLLKDIKQLRLEVSQLASAAGVTSPTDVLAAKYEPMTGVSRWERKLWFVGIVVVAALASSVSHVGYDWLFAESNELTAVTSVSIAPSGSADEVTEITQSRRRWKPTTSFPFYTPKTWTVRWVDAQGRDMPFETSPHGDHLRYDVQLPQDVAVDSQLAYTRISQIPDAAAETDRVWTYTSDTMYSVERNRFTTTVELPQGAELVSAEPKPGLEYVAGGRCAIRFQAVRGHNDKFEFTVRYVLAEEAPE